MSLKYAVGDTVEISLGGERAVVGTVSRISKTSDEDGNPVMTGIEIKRVNGIHNEYLPYEKTGFDFVKKVEG